MFSDSHVPLPAAESGDAAWGDYDNDGDLDLLLSGRANDLYSATHVFRNDGALPNAAPTAPTNPTAIVAGDALTLRWNAATDAQMTASGLSYNVRVGTTPGGSDVAGPMAAANGQRRVDQVGTVGSQRRWTIRGLTPGQTYYWSVQALDGSFAGSSFAAEQTVIMQDTPPRSATFLPLAQR